mmetsp:Transcript_15664/g.16407  ORF Transcript_15664/g.16407 Transcript_15664/m.16407 type:complete len:177 (+) Transcript_15664:92-622(+)
MIRGKLKERFGKTEETKSTDSAEEQQTIPDETTEEINQEEQDETTSIKSINLIRNMMIENGLDGGFSLTMYRIVMTQSWSVTVAAGDEQITNPSYQFEDTISQRSVRFVVEKATNRLLSNLLRKAKRWGNVPFGNNTTVSVALSIPLGFFSMYLEINASVVSMLAFHEKKKAEGKA